ncbi:unnamed protein product [Sympodiomycopsis kandeliae]
MYSSAPQESGKLHVIAVKQAESSPSGPQVRVTFEKVLSDCLCYDTWRSIWAGLLPRTICAKLPGGARSNRNTKGPARIPGILQWLSEVEVAPLFKEGNKSFGEDDVRAFLERKSHDPLFQQNTFPRGPTTQEVRRVRRCSF